MKHFTTIIAVLSIALSSTNARLLDASSTSTWSKQTASDPQDEEDTALPETRVVGGTIAAQGDFPWFVASAGFVSCGGSLVYEDVFLSAAHCDEAFPIGSEVYVGALYRNSPNGGAQKRIITKLLRHPDFDGNHLRNDVMLMKLDSPVDVEPILLNSNELAPEPGETLTAMGFGRLEEEGNAAYFLRQVNITAYDFQRCEDQYENVLTTDGTERLVLDEQVQMCAGYSRGGKGTCQGDSGGPLITSDGIQVGIVSGSARCASARYPGIYARVSAATDFIEKGVCRLSSNPPNSCEFWIPPW